MYKLYTDKTEQFEANIELTGASVNNSFARLILESDKWNLTFNGTINSNGKVIIPIDKLKGILNEGDRGKLKLEVVADDTYFVPWKDEFEIKTNKKVTVEVKSQSNQTLIKENKPSVKLKDKKENKNLKILAENYVNIVSKHGIPLNELNKHQPVLNKLTQRFVSTYKLNTENQQEFISEILEVLKLRLWQ